MTLSKNPYKGTRDYFPEEKTVQNYIFAKWREVCESFGYQEYGTPLLEPTELYLEKSGTELASDQAYSFEDKGGRMVSIRPEATPSVGRLVAQRRQETAYPARLFSIANFMRYERPQKGREREFWQLNVDTFGADSLSYDAETIWLAEKLLKVFGATDENFSILVNHRQLLNDILLNDVKLSKEQIKPLIKLIDSKNKMSAEAYDGAVSEIVGDDEKKQRLELLLSQETPEELEKQVGQNLYLDELKQIFALLGALGVSSAKFDLALVRGLDYYTGMVFEVVDNDPENNRSLFGGGRYDGLVEMFGVEPITAVGFAPGYTTTELFLRTHGLLPDIDAGVDYYIAVLDEQMATGMSLAETLRKKGYKVDVDLSSRKLDKMIKSADKKLAKNFVVVGNNEAQSGNYAYKNLKTGETKSLDSLS